MLSNARTRGSKKREVGAAWSYRTKGDVSAWVLSVVGYPTRGLNGAKGLLRMPWRARNTYTDEIAMLVATASNRPLPFQAPLEVVYCRGYRAREMDHDNLAASAKPVLDALRKAGLIADDNPAHVSLRCTQRQQKELGCAWQLAIRPLPR